MATNIFDWQLIFLILKNCVFFPRLFQFTVFIRGLNCTSLVDYVVIDQCETKPLNYTRNQVYLAARIRKPVKSVTVQIALSRKTSTTFQPFLIDVKKSYCQYISGRGKALLMGVLLNQIRATSQLPKCPLDANVSATISCKIYWNNENDFQTTISSKFFFQLKNRFPILPQGLYKLDISIYGDKKEKGAHIRALGDYKHNGLI